MTNTFGANERSFLTAFSDTQTPDELRRRLWQQSFDLIGKTPGIYRIADFGPTTDTYEIGELGDMNWFWTDRSIYHRADAILIETCSTPRVQLAIERIAGQTSVPILMSITYMREANGHIHSISDYPPEWFAAHAKRWGAAALGVNCGRDLGIDEIVEILRRYRQETDLPLFARPNAGTPTIVGDTWTFPLSPAKLAGRLPEILEAGAVMVGGCCGTTPAHIAAMKPIVDTWNTKRAAL